MSAGPSLNPNGFDQISIAPNGAGWAVRTRSSQLFRFHAWLAESVCVGVLPGRRPGVCRFDLRA